MDDPIDAQRRLRALDDLIAAAEAEVVRLLQVEREAEAEAAHLRLTPPKLLWPEGVTLAVDTRSPTPALAPEPMPELLMPRRRAEPRVVREALAEPPAPAPVAEIPDAASPSPTEPKAETGARPAAPPAVSVRESPGPSASTMTGTLVPVSGLRRPKNLVEALS